MSGSPAAPVTSRTGRRLGAIPPLAGVLAVALHASCGGGGGDGGMGPVPRATLALPSFTLEQDTSRTVDLELQSDRAAAGIQVDIVTPPAAIARIAEVSSAGRASALSTAAVQALAPGRSRVVLFDPRGEATIPPGSGPVLSLTLATAPGAPPGVYAASLEGGVVVTGEGAAFDLTLVPGEVTVLPRSAP